MPILYFLGAADSHVLTEPAPAVFTRADDEPHPYAHVDQEAASAIVKAHPDLFAIKDASPAIVAPEAPFTVADIDAAVTAAKKSPRKSTSK